MSDTHLGLLLFLLIPAVLVILCLRWLLEERRKSTSN